MLINVRALLKFKRFNFLSLQAPLGIRFFHEPYRRGAERYEPPEDTRNPVLKVISGFKELKKDFVLWRNEMAEEMQLDPKMFGPGDTYILWRFNNQEDLDKWILTADKDHDEGYSECELSLTKNNHGLFQGNIDNRLPLDGRVIKSGYCNLGRRSPVKSFARKTYFEFELFTHLVFRLRGDGRNYGLNLLSPGEFDIQWQDNYTFVLYTRGGPYWQTVKIPFSRFILTSKGAIQDKQKQVNKANVSGFGITCSGAPGPFHLEIDYIGVYWDPNYTEEFAYEMYRVPRGFIP